MKSSENSKTTSKSQTTKQASAKSKSKTKSTSRSSSKNSISRSMNTLSSIPAQSPDAMKITALVKRSGKVTGYQLADGSVLNKPDAIALAKDGGIQGVGIAKRNGNEYLKTLPDGSIKTNLVSLPTLSL